MARRVIASVLLAGALTAGCGGGGDDQGPRGITADGEIDVPALVEFVEAARGKAFAVEPSVEFVDRLQPPPLSGTDWDVLRLLSVIEPDLDREEFPDTRSRLGAVGSCCPVTVQPSDDVVNTAGVVVHELVHLLDRSISAFPPFEPRLPEASHATAFIEGLATKVQGDFLELHGRDVFEEPGAQRPPAFPPGLAALLDFPYDRGFELADRVEANGGDEAVATAYGYYPRSAEQVAHPDAYLDREEPVAVEVPTLGDGTAVSGRRGSIGIVALSIITGLPVDGDDLRRWAGDGYTLWYPEDDVCLTGAVEMDAADAATTLTDWLASSQPALGAQRDGVRISLERCLPQEPGT